MSGVIFDMERVLVDSEPVHIQGDIETLQYYGIPAAPEDLEGFTGVQDREMYRRLSVLYGIQEPAKAAGMYVVGFANAGSGAQDLRIADTVISSLVEFPALVERLVASR